VITTSPPLAARPAHVVFLVAIAAILTMLFVASAPASAANERPHASFGVFPGDPVSGETVRLVSYACDPDGPLRQSAWDLDGDGSWDDAFGGTASRAFEAGLHTVSLLATDARGAQSTSKRVISVQPGSPIYVLPRPFTPPRLKPFPIIRLAGVLTERGARIRVLTVRAPVCSRVTVRCRGGGCPFRRVTRFKGRELLHVNRIENRRLRAGATLEVLVSKRDRIGKYSRFRIRRGRAPLRVNACLRFGATRGSTCPRD
jgi:hypothetical protein